MIAAVRACSDQLEFGSRSLKRAIQDLSPTQLAHVPPGLTNSIATLVVHVAGTEIEFAHRLMNRETPAETKQQFRLDLYQPGPGAPIPPAEPDETSASLLAKLEQARSVLMEALSDLSEADLSREVPFAARQLPVSFFLSLLPFHLASHYGQVQLIKRLLG